MVSLKRTLYKEERRACRGVQAAIEGVNRARTNLDARLAGLEDANEACLFAQITLTAAQRRYDDAVYLNQPVIDEQKVRLARAARKLDRANKKVREAQQRRNGTMVESYAGKQLGCRHQLEACRDEISKRMRAIGEAKCAYRNAAEALQRSEERLAACRVAVLHATREHEAAQRTLAQAKDNHKAALEAFEAARGQLNALPARTPEYARQSA